jgi:outer membrane immunogenic protein
MRVSLVLLAALSACLTAGAAHAQALTVPAGADFSGIDLGVDLGAGIGSSGSVNTSGMLAGAHAGYNLQNGPIVGGVVGNILFGNISGGGPNSESFSSNSLASLRARGGYELGNLLLFGSLGWATSASRYQDYSGISNKWLDGYVFGFGAEYAVTRNVSIHAELSHYDFGNPTYYVPSGAAVVSTSQNLLTLGLSAHF